MYFMDYEEAFDKVRHKELLEKLDIFGDDIRIILNVCLIDSVNTQKLWDLRKRFIF